MTIVVARHVALDWADGRTAVPASSFSLHAGRAVGLVGANGSGKSTLLRLLAGELAPSRGSVEVHGRIGFLRQDTAAAKGETVAAALGVAGILAALARVANGDTDDSLYATIGDDWSVSDRVAKALARVGLSGLPNDRLLSTLSGGEQMRVRLAALIQEDPACLLLDEPTNHLDASGRAALLTFLASWPGATLIASHDRSLLEQVTGILELGRQGLTVFGGSFTTYRVQRESLDAARAAAVQSAAQGVKSARRKAIDAVDRQQHRMAQGARHWAAQRERFVSDASAVNTLTHMAGIHARRIEAATARLSGARAPTYDEAPLNVDLPATAVRENKMAIRLEGVTVRLAECPAPLWRQPLSAVVAGPRRIALTGPNGSGKTTLLRLLAGLIGPAAAVGGKVEVGARAVAYLDQALSGLDPRASAADLARRRAPQANEAERRSRLGRLLIGASLAERPLAELSGGERLRAALALALLGPEPATLLLLDEPTNHLDFPSLAKLEAALAGYQGTMIVASHDETFLQAIGCDVAWSLTKDGLSTFAR